MGEGEKLFPSPGIGGGVRGGGLSWLQAGAAGRDPSSMRQTLPVLALVVALVHALAQWPPPLGMVAIPVHRAAQRLLQPEGRRPTEGAQLRGVQAVAAVVARAVEHRADEVVRLVEQVEDRLGDAAVG